MWVGGRAGERAGRKEGRRQGGRLQVRKEGKRGESSKNRMKWKSLHGGLRVTRGTDEARDADE